jgi:hypothetical protein
MQSPRKTKARRFAANIAKLPERLTERKNRAPSIVRLGLFECLPRGPGTCLPRECNGPDQREVYVQRSRAYSNPRELLLWLASGLKNAPKLRVQDRVCQAGVNDFICREYLHRPKTNQGSEA